MTEKIQAVYQMGTIHLTNSIFIEWYFSIILNQNQDISWKSKYHSDGTMYDNYFICGIKTPEGQYTYHYHLDYWDNFKVKELEYAPEYDGHKPEDITRLNSILKQ